VSRRRSPPSPDQRARKLLDEVTDDAASQLGVLRALDDLVDTLPADGVLAELVKRERATRAGAFRARQLALVDEAIARRDRQGPRAHEGVVKALERALTVLEGTEGETGQVRTLRLQLDDARRGFDGRPRPFFARFLDSQRR
jgi:hypothetical protein